MWQNVKELQIRHCSKAWPDLNCSTDKCKEKATVICGSFTPNLDKLIFRLFSFLKHCYYFNMLFYVYFCFLPCQYQHCGLPLARLSTFCHYPNPAGWMSHFPHWGPWKRNPIFHQVCALWSCTRYFQFNLKISQKSKPRQLKAHTDCKQYSILVLWIQDCLLTSAIKIMKAFCV